MPVSALMFVLSFFGSLLGGLARWPILAIGAYLLSFYGHPPSRWWGYALPDLRWAFVSAVVAWVVALRYKSRNTQAKAWYADPIMMLVIAFIGWMWIQTPWAADQDAHLEGVIMMSKYLIIMYAMIKLLDSPRSLELFSVMTSAGCAYFGLLAREMSSSAERLDGVGGPGVDDANTLGMLLAVGVVLGLAQLTRGPAWSRVFSLLCLPFSLNGLILTQSRGAFLGLAAGGFILALLAPKGDRGKVRLLGALGVIAFLALAQNTFWERINTIGAKEGERDFSAETRIVLAHAQLRMFADHPFGAGHRGTAALSRQYLDVAYLARDRNVPEAQRQRSSHNTTLSVLVEQGVPGIIMWVAMLGTAGLRVVRLLRKAAINDNEAQRRLALQCAAIGGALVLVFVSGNFTDYLRTEVQYWLLAMLVAATRLMEATSEETATAPSTSGKFWGRARTPTAAPGAAAKTS